MSKPNLARKADTALQMTLHPRDADRARRVLPQQLKAWAPLVDRVVITIDARPAIDCRGEAYARARKTLFVLLEGLRKSNPGLGVDTVVYADHFRERIAQRFFGGARDWPDHAVDGSPFYGQFFGLMRTNARRTLHLAPEALYEGSHAQWLAGAQARLDADSRLLGVAPLAEDLPGMNGPDASVLLDMDRLLDVVVPLSMVRPPMVAKLKAVVLAREGSSRAAMTSIAQGAFMAGMALMASAESDPQLTRLRDRSGEAQRFPRDMVSGLRSRADRVLGAQLKRLGRI